MTLATQRLDKLLSQHFKISKGDVRLMLAKGRVKVDGLIANDISRLINRFSQVTIDDELIHGSVAHYVMLHKPVGVVCATKDDKHKTVIDLLNYEFKHELHIVGRLDLNTSGLVLLTNDSRWSEAITSPKEKVEKVYQVTLQNVLDETYISAFNEGMYFSFEDITTQPASLKIVDKHIAEVRLIEGKYHQIKRMFGRFRNPVVKLHRSQIGEIFLDQSLSVGESRKLTPAEVALFKL